MINSPLGICVESMDKFRSDYLKFRVGFASGAKGEAVAATAFSASQLS